jgi:hypothetical protein
MNNGTVYNATMPPTPSSQSSLHDMLTVVTAEQQMNRISAEISPNLVANH